LICGKLLDGLDADNGRLLLGRFSYWKGKLMARKFPLHPAHPERICWGCDKYCPADSLQCGNGSGRTQHPAEVLGEDWYEYGDWGLEVEPEQKSLTLPETD
jgi:hypothetical protein